MYEFHPDTHHSYLARLLSLLRTRLPVSIPLYRRIQFAHFTPPTRLILSFEPSYLSTASPHSPQEPWLIAYSDPDRGPETQIFLHGSWEVAHPTQPNHDSDAIPTDTLSLEQDEHVIALLRAFITHVRDTNLYHPSHQKPDMAARVAAALGPAGRATANGGKDVAGRAKHHALLGAVHEATARVLQGFGILDPEFVDGEMEIGGMPERYNKWIFDLRGREGEENVELPEDLRWGEVRERDFWIVRGRTGIPRQDRTLRMLPSVAIYPVAEGRREDEVEPIAWTFLGVDSSLTTLHVEEVYRGRGLAKKLARMVWKKHLHLYVDKHVEEGAKVDERWAHADVALSNGPSNGVCKSLGGYTHWADYWFRADLDKI
ncbi:hypothetical protein B9Z65_1017 [Elsinoe australis]|uniref:FR47-like domain-containing protein n=1 Tax=Elsinoe australis TaxID=40998 RepID=A0A2P8AI35_9PEZI|nr:hypothetical protein B9Z65_1017 [Elsinoe australis]